jgi:hypothetical protein
MQSDMRTQFYQKGKLFLCFFLVIFSVTLTAQNASISLKDYDLKGNVKEVSEIVVDYDTWKKTARTRLHKTYTFNRQGFIVSTKSDPEAFGGNNYVYEGSYSYNNNHTELTYTTKTFNHGVEEKDKTYTGKYDLVKTNIGYLKDLKSNPSIKRNSKGEITDYSWYSYTNPPYASSLYTFEYKNGVIYETNTSLVKSRFDANGVKIYDFVLLSPNYYYYNQDGFLYKQVFYPSGKVTYYYFEYIKDNRGNWIQKRKYIYYPDITKRWDIKEIEYRKITYHDGVTTGSDVFNQNDLDQALANEVNLTKWTDNPWAADQRVENQGCVKGNCVDGFGKWNYEDGFYEGFFKNGKRDGYGMYQWNDQSLLTVLWANDMANGFGLYSVKHDPNFRHYLGYFKDGKFNGKGRVLRENVEVGIYKNGALETRMNFNNNNITSGCTAGDCQNGYGRYIFDNGDQFNGFFVNGVQSSGGYTFKAGGNYSGEFNASGQFHGYGSYVEANNSLHIGYWLNGVLHGKGLHYDNVKKQYNVGIWQNGVLIERYDY